MSVTLFCLQFLTFSLIFWHFVHLVGLVRFNLFFSFLFSSLCLLGFRCFAIISLCPLSSRGPSVSPPLLRQPASILFLPFLRYYGQDKAFLALQSVLGLHVRLSACE